MLIVGLTTALTITTVATTAWAASKQRKQPKKMSFEGLRVDTENFPVLKNDLILRAAMGASKVLARSGRES
jgi:hypothetical protein